MKKTTAKKTTRSAKKPSRSNKKAKKTTAADLKVGPAIHVIKRKTKSAIGSTKPVQKIAKKVVRKSKRLSSVPAATTRKAKQLGRAVGTVLGKAIGNVERAVTQVMKRGRPSKKK